MESSYTSSSYLNDDGTKSTSSFTLSNRREHDILPSSIRQQPETSATEVAFAQSTKRFSMRDSIGIQELTINKLKTDSIGLIGRENELQILTDSLDRITARPFIVEKSNQEGDPNADKESDISNANENANNAAAENIETNADGTMEESIITKPTRPQNEIVFIRGYSGIGKTSLAYAIKDAVFKDRKGILVRGKYDLLCTDEPYSGISAAFREICQHIRSQPDHSQKEEKTISVKKALSSTLGTSEIKLLAKLVPELMFFFMDDSSYEEEASSATDRVYDYGAEKKRLGYAFRMLARAFTANFSPLVLVLDDLQWADLPSLEVIELLLSDDESLHPLMIIGCYRSNEVDDTHALAEKIQSLQKHSGNHLYQLASIELENLEPTQTHSIVLAMLGMDDEDQTRGLADICHRRTLGNPFYVVEFVTMLEWEGLLEFNIGLLKWVWSEEKIEESTMSTPNVVDLLKSRITKLPDDIQLVLQYAACLGSSIHLSTLEVLWIHHAASVLGHNKENLSDHLRTLVESRFIESCGEDMFRFVHDKVKEAALPLGDAMKPSFQRAIGAVLLRELSPDALNDVLFDVVDLINKGDTNRNVEFSKLNLRAAEKAKSLAALKSAGNYVEHGVRLLPDEALLSNHKLYLKLHAIGAQVSFALGHIESFDRYANDVLSRDCFSALEKYPILATQCNKMHTHDSDLLGAIDLNLETLESLGMPRWNKTFLPLNAGAALLRTISAAKKIPRAYYETMPVMSDPSKRAIMEMLVRLNHSCYMAEKQFLMLMSTTRMVRMTLDHGVSASSGAGFATLGLLAAAVLGDNETGSYFAEIGLLMHKLFKSRYLESDTLCIAYQFTLPYTQPLTTCISGMQRGYKIGMQTGNATGSMWSLATFSVLYPYMMGKPLLRLIESCRRALPQIESAKQQDSSSTTRMIWQMALNLTGKSEATVDLQGDIFDVDTFVGTMPFEIAFVHLAKLQLLMIFGDYKRAAKLASKERSFSQAQPVFFIGMLDTLTRGAAFLAMARVTKKREYIHKAKKILNTVEGWVKHGNPNVQHYHHFLRAEHAALRKKKIAVVEGLYQKAIVQGTRSGHLHHAAFFSERYADYLLEQIEDQKTGDLMKDEARHRHKEAIRLYKAWGASAKVEALRDKLLALQH